jgi:predicted transposase/invertase (TIGR01784 family)
MEILFVELPKFLRQQSELNNSLDGWLAFLVNPNKEGIDMAEPVIRKALTVLYMLGRDPETVRLAELRMKKILDEKSMLEGAKEEGKIEGIKEGLVKGLLDSKREDIISFLSDFGTTPEDVMKSIYDQSNVEVLKTWVKLAAKCESIEEFKTKANL